MFIFVALFDDVIIAGCIVLRMVVLFDDEPGVTMGIVCVDVARTRFDCTGWFMIMFLVVSCDIVAAVVGVLGVFVWVFPPLVDAFVFFKYFIFKILINFKNF